MWLVEWEAVSVQSAGLTNFESLSILAAKATLQTKPLPVFEPSKLQTNFGEIGGMDYLYF